MNREKPHGSASGPGMNGDRQSDPTVTTLGAMESGPLRNGNPRGDPNAAPRCGARNRAGGSCRAPAMANGRCRCHGGKSTGPTTQDGMAKLRAARSVHGFYGEDGRAFRRLVTALAAQGRLLRQIGMTKPPP